MIFDLKKQECFSDPSYALQNLRGTLKECSEKQNEDARRKQQLVNNTRRKSCRNSNESLRGSQ